MFASDPFFSSQWPTHVEQIRQSLASRPPLLIEDPAKGHAAVALILRPNAVEAEMLFIERARHPQDPWSGNLAFPGGRIDPGDRDARRAAERETREEIGLDLSLAAYLGRLDDLIGAYLPVRVSCFVYGLPVDFAMNPSINHEVRELFFYPLRELRNPARHIRAAIDWNRKIRRTPALDLLGPDRPLLWGITYRLVARFLDRIGAPLSSPKG